ncbi:MAG TPA: VWA domain-containing protein, partial [Nitrospiria bacterium]|nr:VWA domain-containing protein [Nitrospiria bacterium]
KMTPSGPKPSIKSEDKETSSQSGGKKPGEIPPKRVDKTGKTDTLAGGLETQNVFFYDEWDEAALEVRPKWCRLQEHRMEATDNRLVEETLTAFKPMLRSLRRHFQSLKPEAYRKINRQESGEEIDLNSVVENRSDFRTGRMPSERIYIKTEKRIRDVAVAFLVDLSGSTSRHIPAAGRRVIDIEKEALILMSEALRAVGDAFAIYGFSGGSREKIDFYIIKDFSDPFNREIHERIGSMRSLNQNRDGTAIRHATAKLNSQEAKTRLLILLSDGRPLDSDYGGEHSIQDTKIALRDARQKGIHPYCITVDQEAPRYISEMYGEVRHTIIDRAGTLPEKLPRIYRRLTT